MSVLAWPLLGPKFQGVCDQWEEFFIDNFSGGLCTAYPETSILDNQFPGLTNYYVDDENQLKARVPFRPYLYGSADSVLTSAPLSFMWSELEGSDYLIAWRSGALEYYSSGWVDVVEASALQGTSVEFVKYSVNDRDDLIICDGDSTNAPQRWHPTIAATATTDLGLTAPTTGAAAAGSGDSNRGVATSGTYYYKVTNFYASTTNTQYGESNGGSSFNTGAITVTSDKYKTISISALDVPTGGRVYIYRAPVDNSSGPYMQVGYITSGTTFTDNTPEGEEGVELPIEDGSVPNQLKHPYVFKGRIFGVGALANKLVWTPEGYPDIFPALNHAYLPDPITAIGSFREDLYVFTEKQGYKIPQGDADTYAQPLKVCNKGCTSHRSLVDVGTGLVWQGEDNIYWADFNVHNDRDGDYPIPIGNPIKDKIQNIYTGRRDNTTADLYDGKYIVSFTSSASTINDTTLCWNVRKGIQLLAQGQVGAWSDLNWSANHIQTYSSSSTDRTLLFTADNARKYIMEHGFAAQAGKDYYAYGGAAKYIASNITTKRYHFGHPIAKKIIRSLTVGAKTSGTTYTATFDFDTGDFQRDKNFELGTSTAVTGAAVARYGTAIYGTSTYAADPFKFYSKHHKIPTGGKCKNASLSLSSADTQDAVLAFINIYYKRLPSPT